MNRSMIDNEGKRRGRQEGRKKGGGRTEAGGRKEVLCTYLTKCNAMKFRWVKILTFKHFFFETWENYIRKGQEGKLEMAKLLGTSTSGTFASR